MHVIETLGKNNKRFKIDSLNVLEFIYPKKSPGVPGLRKQRI